MIPKKKVNRPDKILAAFGMVMNPASERYGETLIRICQAEYRRRFGKERRDLTPAQARACLAALLAGDHLRDPDKRPPESRPKAKAKKKPEKKARDKKKPKPKLPPGYSLQWVKTSEFLASYEWQKLRYLALKNSDGCCCLCGRGKPHGAVLNVDHIKPRRTHPHLALELDNLQVLCSSCNHGKGNWDSTDWR